ncbi:arginine repressor [Xylocopilactobacillus apicola]|uniref:Arginine repressor n=1 Tax=Xylocopilactobacillus apicola TaxID=2932184 RepID=A0AAU9DJ60_9LACO|nr:ArgR family transcriptional regulator [Xylocopilactobacillus apicola]BDR58501.1 arginine regulator [Xylocopilactobacillus apicola]
MKKEKRHALISQIINENSITTQDQLLFFLEKYGIKVTQATISRDIRDMHITKVPDFNGNLRFVVYHQDDRDPVQKLLDNARIVAISITQVHFLNVIKTIKGSGNAFGANLDELDFPEITGTVAGLDSVVVISKDETDAKKVYDMLAKYINTKEVEAS